MILLVGRGRFRLTFNCVHESLSSARGHCCCFARLCVTGVFKNFGLILGRDMVLPTTLKKKHCLVGMSVFPLIRKMKEGPLPTPKEFARFEPEVRLEELTEDGIKAKFEQLTGESATEVLEMARVDEDLASLRLLAHRAIVMANEFGQPKGQTLMVCILQGNFIFCSRQI